MMKYAPVWPPQYYWAFCVYGIHMVLAQKVRTDSLYLKWLKDCNVRGAILILDNGSAEGEPLEFEDLIAVANEISADYVILPDTLRDADKTIAQYMRCRDLIPAHRSMVVPQGTSVDEYVNCYEDMLHIWQEDGGAPAFVGVPKHLEGYPGGRSKAATLLRMSPMFQYHKLWALGIYGSPTMEIKTLNSMNVFYGFDTAAAVAFAQHDVRVSEVHVHFPLLWDLMVPNNELITVNRDTLNQLAMEVAYGPEM